MITLYMWKVSLKWNMLGKILMLQCKMFLLETSEASSRIATMHFHRSSTFPMQEIPDSIYDIHEEINYMTCFYPDASPLMKQSCFYLIRQQMKTIRNQSVEFSPLCIISHKTIFLFHSDSYILNRHKCGPQRQCHWNQIGFLVELKTKVLVTPWLHKSNMALANCKLGWWGV